MTEITVYNWNISDTALNTIQSINQSILGWLTFKERCKRKPCCQLTYYSGSFTTSCVEFIEKNWTLYLRRKGDCCVLGYLCKLWVYNTKLSLRQEHVWFVSTPFIKTKVRTQNVPDYIYPGKTVQDNNLRIDTPHSSLRSIN